MKILKKAALILISASVLQSCYKDLSTEAGETIPEIEITGVNEEMDIVWGQELKITPEIRQEGRSDDDFTFLWEIDLTAGNPNNRIEISETKDLEYKVSNSPSEKPYCLTLTVTDRKTGYSEVVVSKIYVGTSLGEGLLVAYTRDGGNTSEIDIVADPVLTYGYSGATRYTRELYALSNGNEHIQGKVLSMSEYVCSQNSALDLTKIMVGTDSHIISLDPLTFTVKDTDSQLFNSVKESSFRTSSMFNFGGYSSCAVVNGTLYGVLCIIDNVYSKVAYSKTPSNIMTDRNFGYYALDQGALLVFNENDSKFYYIYGWGLMNSSLSELTSFFSFDYSGAKALGGGAMKGKMPALLIKDAAGNHYICSVDTGSNDMKTYTYPVNGADMDKIVDVAFCDNSDLMYYATESKIYSVLINGGKATATALSWKPDSSDEKITAIRQYTQGWYGTHRYDLSNYPFQLEYNRLQLLITTYNEKTGEGKIYMRPFNVSTGRFTMKNNGTLTGFGEITAIAPTFR